MRNVLGSSTERQKEPESACRFGLDSQRSLSNFPGKIFFFFYTRWMIPFNGVNENLSLTFDWMFKLWLNMTALIGADFLYKHKYPHIWSIHKRLCVAASNTHNIKTHFVDFLSVEESLLQKCPWINNSQTVSSQRTNQPDKQLTLFHRRPLGSVHWSLFIFNAAVVGSVVLRGGGGPLLLSPGTLAHLWQ